MFYLPTREECQEIVKISEAFYVTEKIVENQNVEMYDYRLASIKDFVDNKAFELRGITFVQKSNDFWERNILLNKFFNYSQTTGWMPEDLDNKKIIRIQDKLDGSIISFVKFENNKIRAKSKMSFDSEQAIMAQNIYDNCKYTKKFIDDCFNNNLTPVFELISPDNQIVLEYEFTELVLLQVRNSNGTYITIDNLFEFGFNADNIGRADSLPNHSLKTLLKKKETDTDYEGFIVTFEDGQMAKIKLNWYLNLHGLIGPDAFRENLLIKTILDENIDDVISALAPVAKKDKIIKLSELVQHKFNHLVVEFKELRRKYFQDFNENRKEFALMYSPNGTKKHELFSIVMKTLNTSFRDIEQTAEKNVKEYILSKTSGLNDAKKWIES